MTNIRIRTDAVRTASDTTDEARLETPQGIVLRGTFGRTGDGRLLLAVVRDGDIAGIDADIARNGRAVRDGVARSLTDGTVVARAVA